jgi:tRNA-binding EMAP/Myf-like protein
MISYDDFKKVEIRAGKILSAEKIPNTDKLLKLSVDFAETTSTSAPVVAPVTATIDPTVPVVPTPAPVLASIITKLPPRQIVSGISMYFPDPAVLVGKTCMFVTNLEPRMIKGYESNGMIFAISDDKGNFSLLEPNSSIEPGTLAA